MAPDVAMGAARDILALLLPGDGSESANIHRELCASLAFVVTAAHATHAHAYGYAATAVATAAAEQGAPSVFIHVFHENYRLFPKFVPVPRWLTSRTRVIYTLIFHNKEDI
eukprot:6196338-Pleurochrysis_carterae.AAC.1